MIQPRLTCPTIDTRVFGNIAKHFNAAGENVGKIIEVFNHSSHRQVQGILDASTRGDFPECARFAHALRGGSASLGAARLSALCGWIEDYCVARLGDTSAQGLSPELTALLLNEHSAALKELDDVAHHSEN